MKPWGKIEESTSFAYCRALRSALAHRGVRIFEGTPVTRLTARGVETPGGAVTARSVAVLTDYELPALGLAAPVYHIQTFLSISRPLRDHEIRTIFPGDRLMAWDTDLIYQYDAFPAVYFAGAGAGLPWAAALGEYLAEKITEGRAEFDDLLSPGRSFPIGRRLQRLFGKPAAFALSHGIAKYLRK